MRAPLCMQRPPADDMRGLGFAVMEHAVPPAGNIYRVWVQGRTHCPSAPNLAAKAHLLAEPCAVQLAQIAVEQVCEAVLQRACNCHPHGLRSQCCGSAQAQPSSLGCCQQ